LTPAAADRILRELAAAGVDFVVIGGVAAVLHGAPVVTLDLDIVHSRAAANLERLLPVLRRLNARYRHRPDFVPELSYLESPGHQLLITDAGPLDLLGTVAGGAGYDELRPRSIEVDLGDGCRILVLSLEGVIELKTAANRDKDRAVLPELRRTLEERRRRGLD
jgi:predicted nucleotidyltransferase